MTTSPSTPQGHQQAPGSRLPSGRSVAVRMTWANLLFLHWPVPADALRPLIPPELHLDTFAGSAWIGLIPFRMQNSRFRGFPALPGLSDFFECNVRTYVRTPTSTPSSDSPDDPARPGVWFFSLDAERLVPVLGARWLWSLNYVHSRFEVHADPSLARTNYRLVRRPGPWPPGSTRIVWQTGSRIPTSVPGSLTHFLTERYWLYTRRFGRLLAGRIAHQPWPLHEARLLDLDDTLVNAAGVRVSGEPAHVCASLSLDVEGAALQRA